MVRSAAPLTAWFRAGGRRVHDRLPWWLQPGMRLRAVVWGTFVGALCDLVRDLRPWGRRNAPLAAGAVLAFCTWDIITLKLNWLTLPYFPGPDRVLAALVADRSRLAVSTLDSLVLLLSGYAIGSIAGVVCGVLIGWFTRARYWGMPILRVFGPVPATALIPLVITLSSQSFVSGAALIAFAVWFPVTILTSSGDRQCPSILPGRGPHARRRGRLYLIFRVALPSALPNIFLGLFMLGWGAFVPDVLIGSRKPSACRTGLGLYLTWAAGYVEFDKVFASILIMIVFFSTLMTLLFKVRDRVLKWQQGVIRW